MAPPAEIVSREPKKTELIDKVVSTCTTPEPNSEEIEEGHPDYNRCLSRFGSKRGTQRVKGVRYKTEF
jgi:hypothetical protein